MSEYVAVRPPASMIRDARPLRFVCSSGHVVETDGVPVRCMVFVDGHVCLAEMEEA